MARFARSNPRVELSVVCEPTVNLDEMIRRGTLDIALVTQCDDKRRSEVVRTEPLLWVTSTNHAVHEEAMLPLAVGRPTCIWRHAAIDVLEAARRDYRIIITSWSATVLAAAVLSGLAVSVLPECALRPGMRVLGEADGFGMLPEIGIGIMPIEVMAERGPETLRHGPMKPMGLTNAHNPTVKPYAVVQLRQDNALGTLYNMVGFQTKLKYGSQTGIFKMIPGLENAEFARLGGLHRNTYLNSPVLLDNVLRLKSRQTLRFAGQVTGCEGYVESSAIGLLAGRFTAAEKLSQAAVPPPPTTAFGALLGHITGGHIVTDDEPGKRSFQPMNVNFGLFPPVDVPKPEGKRLRGKEKTIAKKRALSARALADCRNWLSLY